MDTNLIENMKARGIECVFANNVDEAKEIVRGMVEPGNSVGFGGSQTLKETGVLEMLRSREDINLIDRNRLESPIEIAEAYHKMLRSDVFLLSANAILEDGRILNVDGNGNRVGAMIYGPKKVIIIAGKNKIVGDLNSAFDRVKNIVVPKNLERLKGKDWSEKDIWGQVGIIENQRDNERMHVIIVNEELGY